MVEGKNLIVVITGGTGFFGSYLIKGLLNYKHQVILLKRSTSNLQRINEYISKYQQKLIELCQGFDGILSSLTDKLDAETINKLPESIKIISNFAVGFGNIDLDAAKNRGIAVTNTPDVLTDATAEIGILLILGA